MRTNLIILIAALLSIHLCSCKNVATYPISQPTDNCIENRINGVWKFREDTNSKNFYEIYQRDSTWTNTYHTRFWNRGGENPTYEGNIFFSKIGKTLFINVPYWDYDEVNDKYFQNKGYMFLKIVAANAAFDKLTVAVVNDTTMRRLKNSDEVRAYVTKNMNNKSFFQEEKHFYKVPVPEILKNRGGIGH